MVRPAGVRELLLTVIRLGLPTALAKVTVNGRVPVTVTLPVWTMGSAANAVGLRVAGGVGVELVGAGADEGAGAAEEGGGVVGCGQSAGGGGHGQAVGDDDGGLGKRHLGVGRVDRKRRGDVAH